MKIPLNEISTTGLLRLLRDVAAELEARHNAPAGKPIKISRLVALACAALAAGLGEWAAAAY